ncbi:hypothetical protein Tco_0489542 [Tanacetum coccineum]
MVPRAVLMKSGLVSVNTGRQVNVAHSKITMNVARPMSYPSKTAHSNVNRPIHKNTSFKNSNFNRRVNTIKDKNVNTARPKAVVNAGNPRQDLQEKWLLNTAGSKLMLLGVNLLLLLKVNVVRHKLTTAVES